MEALKVIESNIDYKVGDWVETCHLLPGIVQKIDYEDSIVYIFYPNYALDTDKGHYIGYSQCDMYNCGVHKITPEYAIMLMAIGEERLEELWEKTSEKIPAEWEKNVKETYENLKKQNER